MPRFRFLLAVAVLVAAASPAAAQQVLIAPSSVVFEDGERSSQLLVGNTGDATSLYTLEPAFFRMEPDGKLTELAPPFPGNSAEDLIRFSPRQFELPPGGSQVVRMATRLPKSLPPGEYRIHLRVTNLGEAQLAPRIATAEDGTTTVEIRIQVARAVRVLVRHGVNAGRATLASVSAEPAGGGRVRVAAELARTGKGSSRGVYRIYARGRGGSGDEIVSRGVLIYSELDRRRVEETLPPGSIGSGTELCVAYRDETAADSSEEERCVRPG